MASPRIIFINRFFHPDHSATAQILTDLAVHLAASGLDVHVITSRSLYSDPAVRLGAEEMFGKVRITRVWTSRFGRSNIAGRAMDYLSFYVFMTFALWRSVRRGDVVVAKTDPPLLSVPAAAVARLQGARLVNWLQDLYPEVAIELGMTALRGPVGQGLRSLRNRSLKGAAMNVAIGHRMAARLAAEGLDPKAITVIPNWTDETAITPGPSDSALRRAWGFSAADFVVGYSGNLGRAHEVETLLGAAMLLKDRPQIRFLFVGGGRHSEALDARVAALGLTSFVFRPYQPRENLGQSLGVADIHWLSLRPELEGLIVPSKFFGIAAAGRGVIAVTARTGELAEIVEAHGAGVTVEPGDSQGLADRIAQLSGDRDRASRYGVNARAVLEARFGQKASLGQWERLLREVAGA